MKIFLTLKRPNQFLDFETNEKPPRIRICFEKTELPIPGFISRYGARMTTQKQRTRPFLEFLMRWVLPLEKRDELLWDFREAYFEKSISERSLQAEIWYFQQWLKLLKGQWHNRQYWRGIMLNNYFLIAFRHLKKQKAYTLASLFSLGLGLMCCLMILLYIQDEQQYDRFHPKADKIYRVVLEVQKAGHPTNANGAFGLGPRLKRDFPEVCEHVRIRKMGQNVSRFVGYENKKFNEKGFFFAEPSIFSVFNFPLLRGNPETALSAPNTLVITEKMAKKYFGQTDPMGKVLKADPYNTGEIMLFRITGVVKDPPAQSHLHFDFLASYVTQTEDLNAIKGIWQHYTYLELQNAESASTLAPKLEAWFHQKWGENPWYTPHIQPLLDIHLRSGLNSEVEPVSDDANILTFMAIGLIVLLIAAINFINLTTAHSCRRLKEIGMRKTLGATRHAIRYQLLGESVGFALLSGVAALCAFYLALPLFNNLTGKQITMEHLGNLEIISAYMALILILGLGAGLYTALSGSAFTPVHMLKNVTPTRGSGKKLREALLTFQFILTLTLIMITLAVRGQLLFIRQTDVGYTRDQMLILPMNKEIRQQSESIKNTLLAHPGVSGVTTSNYVPTMGSAHSEVRYGKKEESIIQVIYYVDKDFFSTYTLQLEAGSFIRNEASQTGETEFLITAKAAQEAGYAHVQEILGQRVNVLKHQGSVHGVVKNLNLYALHEKPDGMIFMITPPSDHQYLTLRFKAGQLDDVKAHLARVWDQFVPTYPLDYSFLDENFEAMHRADQQFGTVLNVFSALAVAIACTGLFAMAMLAAQQRRREMGIRKALGATTSTLYLYLSREFVKWTVLANIISWPLAFLLIRQWLSSFAYQTPIAVHWFILATFAVLTLTLLTVSWQAYQTAKSSPAITLKTQ